MFILKKFLSALVLPPSSLILALLAGLSLQRRWPRRARVVMATALALLTLLSLKPVGNLLLRSLESTPPISAAGLGTAQAIVVLGGGSYRQALEFGQDTVNLTTLGRLRYAARLQKACALPLLVSGGAPLGGRPEAESMHQTLTEEFGVPVRWSESASLDTAQNAANSTALLRNEGIQRIALVTDAWHMPRASEEFRRRGFDVIAAPTGFATEPSFWSDWLTPQAHALHRSSIAMHEWLSLLVQKFTGPKTAPL